MEPVMEPVMQAVVQPVMKPVVEPVMEPVMEPVVQPTTVDRAVAPMIAEPASLTPSRIERLEAAFASLREGLPTQRKQAPSAPTRRQVELVVAAAEQLIDTIATRGTAAKVSVRVVVRNSHGAQVEAFADMDNRPDDRPRNRVDSCLDNLIDGRTVVES
jgi:hypothetical protein